MNCSTPGIPVFHYLPEFAQTHVHWVSDAIQPSYPFSILSLPDSLEKTLMLGKIKGFSSELVLCIRWPKCWSFSICPSSEYSRLISFRVVGVMEFQLSYFKSWRMMLWKCCTQYASKFVKLGSGHRTGKVFISISKKGNAKDAQTTAQLHSSHMLVK